MNIVSSKNESGAENWQERLELSWWIVGFVDGEGTFSVSIFKNKTTSTGWQVFPEFVITQGKKSRASLEKVLDFFGVGHIYPNRRYDNHREDLLRYCVRSVKELSEVIIPFFQMYSLRTEKRYDFDRYVQCVEIIQQKDHLTVNGLIKIAEIVQTMNRKRAVDISRILRGHTSRSA